MKNYINKIISGAQTGADRAALDFAIKYDIPHGGWVPKGRISEDGTVPKKYKVKEHKSDKYPPRTAANIHDSDGTIIFFKTSMGRGCALTSKLCKNMNKPCLTINIAEATLLKSGKAHSTMVEIISNWIECIEPKILNIAGGRESKTPGMHDIVFKLLEAVKIELEMDDDE